MRIIIVQTVPYIKNKIKENIFTIDELNNEPQGEV